MLKICCFHTAESNVALYDKVGLDFSNANLMHIVRPDLLARAQNEGEGSLLQDTADALMCASKNSDAVLLTCSTLGGSVYLAKQQSTQLFLRSDEELAKQAAKLTGKIAAFYALNSTLKPTQQIFADQGFGVNNSLDLILVEGAWDLFKAHQFTDYFRLISKAGNEALKAGYNNIVLVQSSMSEAANFITHQQVLTSPHAGLKAIMSQLSAI